MAAELGYNIAAASNAIAQIKKGKNAQNEGGVWAEVRGDSVHIENSYKIKNIWAIMASSFYLNHFQDKAKDVLKGSTGGIVYEWLLHNLAALVGIGGEKSKHVDLGASIFSDYHSHPIINDDGEFQWSGAMSLVMLITYPFINPFFWMLDLFVSRRNSE